MGGTKKKKKKTKLSPAQQEKADLEKAINAIRHSAEHFRLYINRFDRWLIENHERAIKIFQTFDTEHTGKVTYGQFKAGLHDLQIPASTVELHLLCKLLARDDPELIEYNRIARGLAFVRDREERHRVEDVRPPLRVQSKPFSRCAVCSMRNWNGETYTEKHPRFINLTLRLLTFDGSRSHPGHIQCVIHSHLTVFHLGCIVRDTTGVATSLVVVYADRPSPVPGAGPGPPLAEDQSLEDLGFMGGPQNSPVPVTLYYDFAVDFTGCPLLMCDHYFGQKRTMDTASRELRQRSLIRLRQIQQRHQPQQQPKEQQPQQTPAEPDQAPSVDVLEMSED